MKKSINKENPSKQYSGLFITFEGADGAGKSTHIKHLYEILENSGNEVVFIREPGGTKIGEKVRTILLDKENEEMCPQSELLLFEASRAQITSEVIRPALSRGAIVLADRFYDSSLAYQGYARGLNIKDIHQLNMFATKHLIPDRTILLIDINANETLRRATQNNGADRIESAGVDFQDKVISGFLDMAKKEPDRFKIIQLQKNKNKTFKLITDALSDLIKF